MGIVNKFIKNKEKLRKFCFFEKLNIKGNEEVLKLEQLLPKIIKSKLLYDYNETKINYNTYISYYKGEISNLHLTLKIWTKKDIIDILSLEFNKNGKTIHTLLDNSFGSNYIYDKVIDSDFEEFEKILKLILNQFSNEANNFVQKKGKLYKIYSELEEEKEQLNDILQNEIKKTMLEKTFLNDLYLEFNNKFNIGITKKLQENYEFKIFLGYDYEYNSKFKINNNLEYFLIFNFNLIENERGIFHDRDYISIGKLKISMCNNKNKKWEQSIITNGKYLKNKFSAKKWANTTLKTMLIKQLDLDNLLNLK
jgi:hypothetical protein